MRKLKFLLALAFGTSYAIAQNLAVDSIEINTIKAHIYADGGIWDVKTWDDSTYKPLLLAQNLWFAGADKSNGFVSAVQTHRIIGTADFRPGPVSNDPNVYTRFNKVYRINLQTLTDFKNGVTQAIPQEIANWPAHGDTTQGEAYYLAPFIDVNNDGQYVPADGDYPQIKGDEAIFTIFNDINGRTSGNPIGIEVHAMYYAYHTNDIHDSILYMDYRVFNRTNNRYVNFYISSFADFDLGNHIDDMMGTNIHSGSVYAYNGDANDEGSTGFGTNLASCGLRMLQGPPADYFDGIDNDRDGCIDGVIDANGLCQAEDPSAGINERINQSGSMIYDQQSTGVQGLPTSTGDYYNYMHSSWKDGTPLIIESPSGFMNVGNGDGYVTGGAGTMTRFVYPGNTFDTSGAYEPSSPINWYMAPTMQMDKMTLSNAGPFSMDPNESFEMKMAFIWSRDLYNDTYGAINQKLGDLDELASNQPIRTVGLNAYKVNGLFNLSYKAETGEWSIINQNKEDLEFSIYSVSGQFIKSFTAFESDKTTIPLHGLSKGIYLLVEAKSGEAHKITK